jgi:dihydroflavonol-4-reductase
VTAAVLVTGANGFLGSALCRELAGAGHRVWASCREGCDDGDLQGVDCARVTCDLTHPASVRAAVRQAADAAEAAGLPLWIVHNAAVISYRTADAALQRAVNVEGTRVVLEAAQSVAPERVLQVSSVAAVGTAAAGEVLDERASWNLRDARVPYCDTKREAEELALASGLPVLTVNPGSIFGPARQGSNTLRFLRKLQRGELGTLAPPGTLGVVGVEDCARGARLALERGRVGERYLLVESNWSHAALFREAVRVLTGADTLRPRVVHPVAWRGAVVPLARLADALRPLHMVTPQALTLLGRHFAFDSGKARAELGWSPRPLDEVLRAAATALRA